MERAVRGRGGGGEECGVGEIQECIASGMGVAQEKQLGALLLVLEDQLFIEDQVRRLEEAGGDVLAALLALARLLEFLGAVDAQEASAVRLGNDRRAGLGEDRVAVGVIAVVVLVENIANRLIGGFAYCRDDVPPFLREGPGVGK